MDATLYLAPAGEDKEGRLIYRAVYLHNVYYRLVHGSVYRKSMRQTTGVVPMNKLVLYWFDRKSYATDEDGNELECVDSLDYLERKPGATFAFIGRGKDFLSTKIDKNTHGVTSPPDESNIYRIMEVERNMAGTRRMWHRVVNAR